VLCPKRAFIPLGKHCVAKCNATPALTVHAVQSKTFQNSVIIHCDDSMYQDMFYVVVSRVCKLNKVALVGNDVYRTAEGGCKKKPYSVTMQQHHSVPFYPIKLSSSRHVVAASAPRTPLSLSETPSLIHSSDKLCARANSKIHCY
jgi:hypothetical protein